MRGVGHAHWRIRMGRRNIFPRTMSTIFPRTMSPRLRRAGGESSVRAELLNETDVVIDVSYETCKMISVT